MKKKTNAFKIVIIIFLILYTALLFVQWGWAIITSLKDYYDFRANILGLPKEWRFDNYLYVLQHFSVIRRDVINGGTRDIVMWEMYVYAILYAVGCAFTSTFVPFVVSYLVARFDFKPLNIIYYIVVICMIVPIVGTLPAQVRLATRLNFYDQIWGMWIMTGHFLGLYFLIFHATFKSIPMGYSEAAKIDGASNINIMFRVVFPLARNIFFTVFLLYFVQYWNDYQTPLLFIPNWPTISLGLFLINSSNDPRLARQPGRLASCMLVMLPVFIVFLVFRERLMGNLSMGGMKE